MNQAMLMPRKAAVVFAIALLASGCALNTMALKNEKTSFEPVDGGFRYKGFANFVYPVGSADGEAWRMQILQSYLDDNGTCAKGYEITSRKPVSVTGGSVYDIFYEGRCK